MPLTSVGAAVAASLFAGDGDVAAFGSSQAHIGVGDSNTAFSTAQTDLQASTNKFRKAVSSVVGSFPSAQRIYSATFDTSEANYAWLEVGLFNALSADQMAIRKVITLPTKTNTETWTVNLFVNWVAGS